MNSRLFRTTAFLFICLGAAALVSCEGTSTGDYLNGDFISSLGEDTTAPNILIPRNGEKVLSVNPASMDPVPLTLQWTAKNNAANYTVEIATDPGFEDQISGSPFTVNDVFLEYTPTDARRYYWRVRADITAAGSYGSAYFDAMDDSVYVYCPGTDIDCNDTGMVGNKDKPYKTINAGVVEAQRLGLKNVRVAARSSSSDVAYVETVPILNGVNFTGGYRPLDEATPDTAFSETERDSGVNRTVITGDSIYGIFANNIFQTTVVDGFVVNGPDEFLGTFALYIVNSSKKLVVKNCVITGGSSEIFYTVGAALVDSFSQLEDNSITGGKGRVSAGMMFEGYGSPDIKNCTISGADLGTVTPCDGCESTGMLMDWGFPFIDSCTISGGSVTGDDSRSVGINVSNQGNPTLTNCNISSGDIAGGNGETVGIKTGDDQGKASVTALNNYIRSGNISGTSVGGKVQSFGLRFKGKSDGTVRENFIIAGDIVEDSANTVELYSYGISFREGSEAEITNNVITTGSIVAGSASGTHETYGVFIIADTNDASPSLVNNTIRALSAEDGTVYVLYASGQNNYNASPVVNNNMLFSDTSNSYGYYEGYVNISDPQEFSSNLIFNVDILYYYSNYNVSNMLVAGNITTFNELNTTNIYTTSDNGSSCNSNMNGGGTSFVFTGFVAGDPTTWIILPGGIADVNNSGGWDSGDIGADTANIGPQ